jgi:hypothetical protein
MGSAWFERISANDAQQLATDVGPVPLNVMLWQAAESTVGSSATRPVAAGRPGAHAQPPAGPAHPTPATACSMGSGPDVISKTRPTAPA